MLERMKVVSNCVEAVVAATCAERRKRGSEEFGEKKLCLALTAIWQPVGITVHMIELCYSLCETRGRYRWPTMDVTRFGALLVLTLGLETRGRLGVTEPWTCDSHE